MPEDRCRASFCAVMETLTCWRYDGAGRVASYVFGAQKRLRGVGLNGHLFPLDPRRAARLAAKTALAARLV